MVKTKVKGWIFNVEEINKMYEYYLKLLESKDNSVGIDDIKQLKSDIEKIFIKMQKTQDDIFEDERPETEEEAKKVLGQEFIDEFENIRKKCDIDGIRLEIHGTTPKIANLIQKQGLLAKTTNCWDTMVIQNSTDILPIYDDYSGLLNWGHKLYKGLVLIGIPTDCLTLDAQRRKPLWEKRDSNYKKNGLNDLNFRIRPEFIIGYLDIDRRKIIKNELYRVQHNYEGLINDTTDEQIISTTHDDYNTIQTKEDTSLNEVSFPEDLDEKEIKIKFRKYADYMLYCLAMTKRSIEDSQSECNILKLQNGDVAIPPIFSMNKKVFSELYDPVRKLEEDVISFDFEENLEEIIHNTSTHEINQTTKILSELSREEKELDGDDLIL